MSATVWIWLELILLSVGSLGCVYPMLRAPRHKAHKKVPFPEVVWLTDESEAVYPNWRGYY